MSVLSRMTMWQRGCWSATAFTLWLTLLSLSIPTPTQPVHAADYEPKIAAASHDGEQAISRFQIPKGFKVTLVAAEPQVANPVALAIDPRGRFFVAETFRQGNAVVDNRDHMFWLDDDLAAMTVEDRLAYHKKHLKEKLVEYTREHDRIRLLEDTDGDGKVDSDKLFTDGYNDALEGTGAGVLVHKGDVYYTNIPHVWKLRDTNADGQADVKTSLHYGYGVRVAFRGHDLHGLRMGPDGRVYFSCGDRGFNVTQGDRHFVYPDQGAVLRCNPDGSELEVIHTGLRNPQELAFDDYGNLLTCDNNSDGGDRARVVPILEGADSGWRMNYQYLNDRGPWNREKLWHPQWDGQAAYIVPPVLNFADGPSGLTYAPGLGLPDEYKQHFFLCDFRGQDSNSGIRSFALKNKGAGYELVDAKQFWWSILATDVDFGPDGAMYACDWVEGWNGPGKGRIYRLTDPSLADSAALKETRKLLAEGMSGRSLEELAKLLAHPYRDVRQAAQFELADRGTAALPALTGVATKSEALLARLHAVWGLGQIARKQPAAAENLRKLADDKESEVRAQTIKTLADLRDGGSRKIFIQHLSDSEPRVQYFAALGCRHQPGDDCLPGLLALLERAERDPYLRHGGIMGLAGSQTAAVLAGLAKHESETVRLAAVVALRRQQSPEIRVFLNDSRPTVVEEAARAIYDLPISAALNDLAALSERAQQSDPTWNRVINALYRLGTPEAAESLARLVARDDLPESQRIDALQALSAWEKPSGRDRVLGSWRPLPNRDVKPALDAVRGIVTKIFSGSDPIRQQALETVSKLKVLDAGKPLLALIQDAKQPVALRAKSLTALAAVEDPAFGAAAVAALSDPSPELRISARDIVARVKPELAVPHLVQAIKDGTIPEKQAAVLALGQITLPASEAALVAVMEEQVAGTSPPELTLDVLEAARKRNTPPLQKLLEGFESQRMTTDPLREVREVMLGGNKELGRKVFFEKAEVSCVRCHKIGGQGGDVGPDLTKISHDRTRDHLLTAIVLPDAEIAKGFETLVLLLNDGKTVSGIVKADTGKELKLVTPDVQTIIVKKDEIDEQSRGKSGMPADLWKKMSRRELRDLLEFLHSLKEPAPEKK